MPMLKLLKYLRPYRKQLILVVALLLVQAVSNLYLPDLNADIINNGIAKGDTDYILRTGGFMLLVTFLLAGCSVISVYWGSKTAMSFGRDLRSDIFRKVQTFSQAEVDLFGTPSLITRNTNDVQNVDGCADEPERYDFRSSHVSAVSSWPCARTCRFLHRSSS